MYYSFFQSAFFLAKLKVVFLPDVKWRILPPQVTVIPGSAMVGVVVLEKNQRGSRIWRALKGIQVDEQDGGQLFGADSSCHLLSAYFNESPSWAQARQNHAACCISVSSTWSCSTACSKVSLLALNPCSCVHKQCKPTAVGSIRWSSSALATQWELSRSTHTHTRTLAVHCSEFCSATVTTGHLIILYAKSICS